MNITQILVFIHNFRKNLNIIAKYHFKKYYNNIKNNKYFKKYQNNRSAFIPFYY